MLVCLLVLPISNQPSTSEAFQLEVSVSEFDGFLVPGEGRPWVCPSSCSFQLFGRIWSTEEGVDSYRLFQKLNKVRSGIWHMPWPSPATKGGCGDIDLRPANMTYGADQAGWIVKTPHRLVVLGAEAP